ncbi:DEAD/DEAH box helicase [Halobacillus sp. Nhm2S1]|uniref:DEAD/DEAH box helicase n=1 Tax=Halobacillus sp. Nhm2S1 TaxID=2866716 RepID=UPI001C72E13F|nr:DEAD/DEAH box helicase [Halobacillus sp. Nhm2S1]MBX0358068.1 DEAD/DEAH box helicase [Halobacillus sp. Nhm2S1]
MTEINQSWFEELSPSTKEAWQVSGYESLTKVQEQAIPFILQGTDVVAEAPTGSGKTLAYLLPLIEKVDPEQKHTQVLIMASSHELVMQIHQEVQTWTKGSGITSMTMIGGANIKRQMDKLKKKPHIVVGTPGRVYELIQKKKLKAHEIKAVIMDEADQLLVPEHIHTVEDVLKSTMRDTQTLLFSATLPDEVIEIAQTFMDEEAEVIRVTEELKKPDVTHTYIVCEDREKIETLRKLARMEAFKGLAFMQDIAKLNVMAEKLTYKHLDIGLLHSDAKKEQRAKAIKEFRKGEYPLLLATDVAARGLDIIEINHIINLDVPKDITSYIHRAGRTGRIGSQEGTVVSLVNPVEEKRLKKFARDLELPLHKAEIYKGKLRFSQR